MKSCSMDKRLAKRHKRQVSRERERVKLSEPDLGRRKKSRPPGKPAAPPEAVAAIITFETQCPHSGIRTCKVPEARRKLTVRKAQKLCSPRVVRIANRSISEASVFATRWSKPSTGSCGPTAALFAATTFSCCGGWRPWAELPKKQFLSLPLAGPPAARRRDRGRRPRRALFFRVMVASDEGVDHRALERIENIGEP